MWKNFNMMLAFVCIAGCRSAGPVAAVEDAPRYFPLAAGNTWEYDWTYNNGVHDTTISHVVTLGYDFVSDGVRWFPTIDVCPAVLDATPLFCAEYARTENKTFARRVGPIRYFQAETILDFPLFNGKSWTIEDEDTTYVDSGGNRIHSVRFSRRYVRGVEAWAVPAGLMAACFHIEDSTRTYYHIDYFDGSSYSSSSAQHADEWFAPDAGLVKQIVNSSYSNPAGAHNYRELFELRSYSVRLGD